MTIGLRVLLIVGSILTCIYVLSKIRKSKMRTENSLFWIMFSFVLVILGLFPGIAIWFARLLGVQSTVNLVFLVVIFFLLIKVFLQDQRAAKIEAQLTQFSQRYAIDQEKDWDENGNSARGTTLARSNENSATEF